jgi:hypothetical protein
MKWYKTSEELPKLGSIVWVINIDKNGDMKDMPTKVKFIDDDLKAWEISSNHWRSLNGFSRWRYINEVVQDK